MTTASAFCVRLLVRSQRQLRRSAGEFRNAQAEHSQQWQQHVAALERKYAAERSVFDAQLAEQAQALRGADRRAGPAWQEQLDRQQAAVALLADEQLPDALKRLRAGEAIDDVLPTVNQCAEVSADLRAELRKVLRTALIGVEEEFNRSTSAEQAVISIGSRIHVLTSKLRGRLHEMQGEHGRLPAVAQGLMELDQEIGPADCLAASIGVLGGSDRPGRQWQEPQRLLSVVRGGIGRIKDFDRIQVRHLPELGVDGGLVDHLTLIFAHLLDNAARYSPPTEPVVVSGKEVPERRRHRDPGLRQGPERGEEAGGAPALDGRSGGPRSRRCVRGRPPRAARRGQPGPPVRHQGHVRGLALARHLGGRGGTAQVLQPAARRRHDPGGPGRAGLRHARGAEHRGRARARPGRRGRGHYGAAGGCRGHHARRSAQAPQASGRDEPGRPKPVERDAAATSADTASHAVPPDASFAGLAAFATAGREPRADRDPADTSRRGRESTEHRTEESD